jgi:GT2 family glycosyltransferase
MASKVQSGSPSASSDRMQRVWHRARQMARREANGLPTGLAALPALGARARRAIRYVAQDVRGWPSRVRTEASLREVIARAVPIPATRHAAALGEGYVSSAAQPVVSVIIPVYGKLDYTLRCLVSIGASRERTPFEIIVVDDASPDDTSAVLSRCPGIRIVRNERNSGFLDTANRGAREARGTHLLFLNNDTVVLPGWLDRLVETFETTPNAGLVGSRLIYPDLRLQESGGIVFRDASATNWGHARDPFNPSYTFLRDTDYVSFASAMMPRALFESIGGFDVRFRPAYYEDTDLAFAVRAAGKRVLVQPASRVIHHEGGTSGTDTSVGPKRHQVENQARFREKWASVLGAHSAYGDVTVRDLDRRAKQRVLFVVASTPRPDEDSGSIDLFETLRILVALGSRVTFVPALVHPVRGAPDVRAHDGKYTEALERIGIECPVFPYEPSLERLLRERGREFDLVVLARARIADRYLPAVRRSCPNARVIFHSLDLAHVREAREATLKRSALLGLVARDTKRRELRAARRSDMTLVISDTEAAELSRLVPDARVRVLPLVRSLPTIDATPVGRSGVLFVGHFRHRPNVDAVQFLVREVWPLVRAKAKGTVLHVVGSATPDSLRALATDDIVVHGHVADLGAMLATMRATIAPLRFGAGLKGKIAESLAHGVPCVTTTVGVEGSGLVHERNVLIADDAEGLARETVRVCADDTLWRTLSAAGLAHVSAAYSVQACTTRIAALLDELGMQDGAARV